MSAFFVARATIDATVALVIAEEGPLSPEGATDLGRALWAMNAEAVRWRYDLDTGTSKERAEHAANLAEVATYAWTPRDLDVAVFVKSLDCLVYQCAEGPCRETPLFQRLASVAISHTPSGIRETDSYRRAPRGLEEENLPVEATFRSELTPEGEQFVIPGCERNRSKVLRQLDLFG